MSTIVGLSTSKDHSRDASSRGQNPDEDVDDFGFDGCAEIQGLNRVTHGHISVHAHHGEREDAGEHVVVVNGDEDLADHLSKGPRVEQIVCTLKGHGGGHQGIGYCQVEDVDIGGCFHLSVSTKRLKHFNLFIPV